MACGGAGAPAAGPLMKLLTQKHLLIMLLTAMCRLPLCLDSKHSQGVDALSWKPKDFFAGLNRLGLCCRLICMQTLAAVVVFWSQKA